MIIQVHAAAEKSFLISGKRMTEKQVATIGTQELDFNRKEEAEMLASLLIHGMPFDSIKHIVRVLQEGLAGDYISKEELQEKLKKYQPKGLLQDETDE